MLFRPSLISAQLLIVDSVHALRQCNTLTLTLTCPCHVVDASAVVSVYRAANCRLRQCHQKPIPRWSHSQWKTAKCDFWRSEKAEKLLQLGMTVRQITLQHWSGTVCSVFLFLLYLILNWPRSWFCLWKSALLLQSIRRRWRRVKCHLSSISAQFIIADLVPLVIFIRHVDIWHYIVNSISHHTTK